MALMAYAQPWTHVRPASDSLPRCDILKFNVPMTLQPMCSPTSSVKNYFAIVCAP